MILHGLNIRESSRGWFVQISPSFSNDGVRERVIELAKGEGWEVYQSNILSFEKVFDSYGGAVVGYRFVEILKK